MSTVVCLPAAVESETAQCEGAARQAVDSLRVLLGEPWLLPGAGAWEAGVAAALRGAASVAVRDGAGEGRDAARTLVVVAQALECAVRALGECDPLCGGGGAARGGLQCGVCCCRAWGVARAAPEGAALPEWVTAAMGALGGGCVLHFPRFDRPRGREPARACKGDAADQGVTLMRGRTQAELGAAARSVLPAGSRVLPVEPRDAFPEEPWTAVLLRPGGGVLDGAATARRGLLRAIQAAEIAVRTDAEVLPAQLYDQAMRASQGATEALPGGLFTSRLRLAKSGRGK